MHSVLLVPSPLLGPSSWAPFARVLNERGMPVAVADLRPALQQPSPMWPEMVRLAHRSARSLEGGVVVMGHSGAGALLPGIGAALGEKSARLVFVDAVLPPPTGAHRYPAKIREQVAELATNHILPPWLDWWPTETVTTMLPDPALVDLLRSDITEVPDRWFEEEIPVPTAWTDGDCSYLRLSESYADELENARELGWPTASIESNHLGILTEPATVADAAFS